MCIRDSVCVVPGDAEVDLKLAAKVSGNKSAAMIHMKELLPATGYIRGGCSPVGMKKALPTFIHTTCMDFGYIYISAGMRGLQIRIAPVSYTHLHGSIIVNIKLDEEKLSITAPFVALPEKGRIPLLRQVAGLNFNAMDLATIYLRDNRLSFEYSCPIQLINPYKIYYILQEICCTGDKYDDEFETKFGRCV